MIHTENSDVFQGDVDPTDVNQDSQQHESNEIEESASHEGLQPNDKDRNFEALRQKLQDMESERSRIEKERDEAARRNEELHKALMDSIRPQAKEFEEEDDFSSLSDEDWTTKKYVDRLESSAEKKARLIVEEAIKKDREERYRENLPNLLKQQYADFDDVVTKENVEYLKAHKPHIAAALAATTDPYAQAVAAYDYIKAYRPNANVASDKKRMEQNASKPGTLAGSHTSSPLSQAQHFERGTLTPEMKAKLHAEMVAASRAS